MRNEAGHFPEVCKKSLQAMVADMQAGPHPDFFPRFSIAQLRSLSPRELEWCGRLAEPSLRGPGDTHYRHHLGRRPHTSRPTVEASRPDAELLLRQRAVVNEAGFLLQLFAGCSAPTTSTTARSTAIRPAASG